MFRESKAAVGEVVWANLTTHEKSEKLMVIAVTRVIGNRSPDTNGHWQNAKYTLDGPHIPPVYCTFYKRGQKLI